MAFPSLTGFDFRNQKGINAADPSGPLDVVNKQYLDNRIAGLAWKQPVVVATTTNGTLATAYANGQSIDGYTLVTGDRILLKDQTTQTENGIYIVAASGSPTRASDADSTSELESATVYVVRGTVNADRAYSQTTNSPTIGSDNIVWAQVGGGTTYTADGDGIELSGTTFLLELDGSTLSKSSAGLRLAAGIAGGGIVYNDSALDVNVGAGLEISSDAVRIAASAAGAGLTGGAGAALAVGTVGGSGITVNADDIAVDPTVVVRKFSTDVGNGTNTSYTVTHNLGTKAITWSLRTNADDSFVYADVVATSTTQATVTFAVAPTTNQYNFTIHG